MPVIWRKASAAQHLEQEKEIDIPASIVATVIGVTGTIAAVILAHFLSRRRERHARFAAAALAFRSAFSAELAALEPNVEGPKSVEDFLRSAYEKHRSAAIIVRDFLPDKQRANFDADWQTYHSGQEIDGEPVDLSDKSFERTKGLFLEYSPWPGGFQRRDTNPKTLAAERIDKLLSYARHT